MDTAPTGTRSAGLDSSRQDEFRVYLTQLLSVPSFSSSRRRGQLLRYLVERTLAGRGEEVTEYGIALDVFEKPPSFDPRSEATVRVEMSRLRRALAEHYEKGGAADPWRIELPARGYIPTIQACDRASAAAAEPASPAPESELGAKSRRPRTRLWIWAGLAAIFAISATVVAWYSAGQKTALKSVVVLPFANMTGDPKNEYLADGITEQLTDALAQIPTLRVVARTSAFQFKGKGADIREIGRRLKADAVVEGSLRSINGSYRLTVQVNRSHDGYHIFSRTFDGGIQELGRMENDMAPLVLSSLRPRIAIPKRKAPDPQAYDLFLKARASRIEAPQDGFKHAVAFLNQAIERDPGYAEAYGALAGVYAAAAGNFATEAIPYAEKARAAAATALQLDPESADAYAAQGFVDGIIFMDWRKGERELRGAIRLSPQSAKFHSWLAANLLYRGRFVESIAEFRRIDDLDPLAPNVALGVGYFGERNYDAALQQFTRIRDLHPDLTIIHSFLGAIWEVKGQYDKAMAEYKMLPPAYATMTNPQIAHLLASMGRIAEARKMLSTLEESASGAPAANPFMIACIHARLGDRDLAFHWLNRAYQQHMVWFLKIHPSLDSIRDDPRYSILLNKSGLAD